jgi:GNAT superfamily N-acetyltransferase
VEWLVRREFFVLVRELDRDAALPMPDDSIRWTDYNDEHAALLLRLNPALGLEEIARRRREGQVCELAFSGDSPAHYRWTARSPVYLPYLGKSFVVDTGDVLVTEVFTHPAFRRRGVHRQSVRRSVTLARRSGSRRHLSLVAKWNAPVLSTAHKTGAHMVGSVGFWNFGFFRHFFASGTVTLEGNRFRIPEDRPCIRQRRFGGCERRSGGL